MEINGKEVPFTATHYNTETGEFLRIGKGQYAQCYVDDKYWADCATLKNYQLPKDGYMSISYKYRQIFKTGVARDLCNIRLMWIGSSYRIR
ncbi:hypothetical protein [Acinetobacter venetianus]|uniref:Uncharacterized protein n=1 Tax=Acinetobacter venetianus TaxID=52133 RepID=A0A150HY49_9GAMM|nr:hypothetical protein [Acinetobacter venetianus]KXZ72157.1 hypothetical protein AVENLUH13518_00768 [Acinetobacter venetianus]